MKQASRFRTMATLAHAAAFLSAMTTPAKLMIAALAGAGKKNYRGTQPRRMAAQKDGAWRGRWIGSMKVSRIGRK